LSIQFSIFKHKKIHSGGSFFILNLTFFCLICIGFIYLFSTSSTPQNQIQCISFKNTGVLCPTCGFTRSFSHFILFDFKGGILINDSSIYFFIFLFYIFFSRLLWILIFLFKKNKVVNKYFFLIDLGIILISFFTSIFKIYF
jgi:hypothetical protein